MKHIALVVQRYGREVNGGAELLARLVAQALTANYHVDVLTSRALDYHSWATHYPAGEEWIDGVRVLRFDHPPRDPRRRRRHMPLGAKLRFKLRRWVALLGLPAVSSPTGDAQSDGLDYLVANGPTMNGLLDFLREHGDDYAALVFMTALYAPAAMGVLVNPSRSILVPHLHDEKAMYLPHFHRVFHAPRQILYNTRTEQSVATRLYGADIAHGEVCGVGINPPAPIDAASADAIAKKHGVSGPYLIFVGRVDRAKGCAELFRMFEHFRKRHPQPLQLVVCGRLSMPRPTHPDILLVGFVSDAERDALVSRALALVLPSRYESLSMVMLEAMMAGCPVLVHRHSPVLMAHVLDSGVGQGYAGFAEFEGAVNRLLAMPEATRSEVARQGQCYVRENYDWANIVAKYRNAIEQIASP